MPPPRVALTLGNFRASGQRRLEFTLTAIFCTVFSPCRRRLLFPLGAAVFAAGPQRSTSSCDCLANSSGVLAIRSKPSGLTRCFISGVSRIARISLLSFFTIGAPRPAGPSRPAHCRRQIPAGRIRPWSAARASAPSVQLRHRNRPGALRLFRHHAGTLANSTCTCPPIRSISAGFMPLFGTCTISMPALLLSISPARCEALPTPAEP